MSAPPAGWIERRGETARLWVRVDLEEPAVAAGLDRPAGWERAIARHDAGSASGRGPSGVVRLGAMGARLKQLRRGGLAGPLWRERFIGRRRLHDNVHLPLEARRAGVPTPEPLALLVAHGPRGLWRGWLATEELEGARELEPARANVVAELVAALAAARRLHDAGFEHRDLNLGNLLVRERPDGGVEGWVIDLDGARRHAGPLGPAARARSLARLARSLRKRHGFGGTADELCEALDAAYAAGDVELEARLARR